ncbi:hypothetical protein DL237_11740 [Pseudooceanicola sediminis]|uniref:TIGR02186 family protein n=1 Tax=Pseudooceanicola sediminis TaxID=2211117 RepID=A0A399J6Z2_9RHOB|nr:TIGR02186 family protein [Pseudooceanicola sediminis]KAA2313621.1 hypothetical protein E0K93_13295 [Puniceibacterium sp. HSS470]RII38536.1 hypothetical protein DL237_11740 [Pseudooceanicola sediminis]|tara:strand:- start:14258 stop:15034 length:777 start_codon:yes stop_codon:yes gene_type:complete
MRARALLAALVLALLPATLATAQDEEVVLGLSQNRVAINANFDGSEILIFGAVKRDAVPILPALDVIVTVAGPNEPLKVMRKERRAGIWVNTDQVTIRQAPSFYAVSTTQPLSQILTQTEDLRHRISIPRAIRSITSGDDVLDEDNFVNALIRLREQQGTYLMQEKAVRLDEQTLFNTRVALPSNLTEGVYRVDVYLLREGRVITSYETALRVGKVGLEQWLYALAHEQALAYALLAIFIAVISGWAASEVFRLIRNQ